MILDTMPVRPLTTTRIKPHVWIVWAPEFPTVAEAEAALAEVEALLPAGHVAVYAWPPTSGGVPITEAWPSRTRTRDT